MLQQAQAIKKQDALYGRTLSGGSLTPVAFELPALTLLLGFACALAVIWRMEERNLLRFSMTFGAISLFCLLLVSCLNFSHAGFYWPDEPNTLAISAGLLKGQPIYHDLHAPWMYSLLYGPLVFLFYAPLLAIGGGALLPIRIAIFAVNLVTAWGIYRLLRLRLSRALAFGLTGIAIACLVSNPLRLSLGVAPDELLLMLVTLGLLGAMQTSALRAVLFAGLCSGLMVNCKITLVPIAALLLALLWRRFGLQRAAAAAALALLVAALPFLLPGISFSNYLTWINVIRSQGFSTQLLFFNCLFAVFLFAGSAALWWLAARKPRFGSHGIWVATLFALCILIAVLTGSKNGSGPWHLWPLLPFIALWLGEQGSAADATQKHRAVRVLAALTAGMALVCLRYSYRDIRLILQPNHAALRQEYALADKDLRALAQTYRGRNLAIAAGTSAFSPQLNLRYELQLWGDQDVIDPVAYDEMRKANANPPPEPIQRALGCTDLWLVRHGDTPFSTVNYNEKRTTMPYIFPDELRLGFLKTHRLLASGPSYDVWSCP